MVRQAHHPRKGPVGSEHRWRTNPNHQNSKSKTDHNVLFRRWLWQPDSNIKQKNKKLKDCCTIGERRQNVEQQTLNYEQWTMNQSPFSRFFSFSCWFSGLFVVYFAIYETTLGEHLNWPRPGNAGYAIVINDEAILAGRQAFGPRWFDNQVWSRIYWFL